MTGDSGVTLNQRGYSFAVAAQLEQETAHVRIRAHEYDEDSVFVQDRDNGESRAMFEHRRAKIPALNGAAELVGRADNRWDKGGETFGVYTGYTQTVDHQPIPTKDDRCFHAFALADRSYEVSNAGHSGSTESDAKIKGEVSEVKL